MDRYADIKKLREAIATAVNEFESSVGREVTTIEIIRPVYSMNSDSRGPERVVEVMTRSPLGRVGASCIPPRYDDREIVVGVDPIGVTRKSL